MRGYLSASLIEDGAEIDYVWDVFTAAKQRVQRLNDVIAVKGGGDDPWRLAGEAALISVAANSADDLAAFLSNTPEAAPVAAAAESLCRDHARLRRSSNRRLRSRSSCG